MVRLFLVFSALGASEDVPLGELDDAVSLLQLSTRRVEDLDNVDESAPPAVDAQRYPVAPKPPMGPDGTWGTPWCKDHRGCTPYCPNGCDGAAYWDAPFPNDRIGIPDINTGRRNNKMNFYACAPGKDLGVPIGKFQNGLTFTYMQCLGSENATKPPFFKEHDLKWKTEVGPRKPGMVRNGWNGGKYPSKGESMEGFGFEYCPDDCVNDCALFKWGNFHQCGTSGPAQWFYDGQSPANRKENNNCRSDMATYKGAGTESYLWCGERTTTTTTTPEVEVEDDEAAAVEDPHITTNSGKRFDLSLKQKVAFEDADVKGNDLVARTTPDNARNIEFVDRGAGAFTDAGTLSSVRFYAQRPGNKGLRFRIYRPNGGGFTLVGQTEEIEIPQAGVIQEVAFSEPVDYEAGDYIGWCHNADGNIPFGNGGGRVSWEYSKNNNLGVSRGFGAGGARTYSYEVTTSPKTTTTPPPPPPPANEAAAEGDPHLTLMNGAKRDLEPADFA